MNQNMFGQPQQAPEPAEELTPVPTGRRSRTLLLGGAGVAAVVLVGATALFMTTGPGDEVATAPVPAVAAPAAPTPTETSEAPAPLPTLAEFNGRNPFKAKVVEGGAAAAAPAAAGGAAAADPASADAGDVTTSPGAAAPAVVDYLIVTYRGEDPTNPADGVFEVRTKGGAAAERLTVGEDAVFGDDAPYEWVKHQSSDGIAATIQFGDSSYVLALNQPVTLLSPVS